MKKLLSLLLAALMLMSMLASCGTPGPGGDTTDDPSKEPTADPSTNPSDDPTGSPSDEPAAEPSGPEGDRPVGTHADAEPQRSEYELVTAAGHNDGPYLVKTVYKTEYTVVADVIATDAPYRADPTGTQDSTLSIQAALDACAGAGGGTVFLPVGEYLVTDTIDVPAGVVLQGDWQDPDLTDTPAYGTVILADLPTLEGDEIYDPEAKPLFNLLVDTSCNSSLIGLTVYYPEQDENDIKPYGFTVYSEFPRMVTLRDLTFINSYRGIGAALGDEHGYHELLQIENVRMTALSQGYRARNSSEVGYTVDLRISPRYWRYASEKYACDDIEAVRAYCRENLVAMEFDSLDLNQYTDLFIGTSHTAMLFRGGFWGVFYGLEIKDAAYGVVAESMSSQNGVVIANATIEADEYAVLNHSVSAGVIKLTDVETPGKGSIVAVEGARITVDNEDDLAEYRPDYGTYQKPADILYVADVEAFDSVHEDAAPALQAALDEAAETGGIVYVPQGVYTLYSTITVPEGVELRGALPTAARDRRDLNYTIPGTVLIAAMFEGDLITLKAGAGVQGVRIYYSAYDAGTALLCLEKKSPLTENCVAIRGAGAGVYVVNTVVTGSFVGIDFTGCDDHLIKQTFGCCYANFIRAGGKNGHIESVLCNQTFTYHQPFHIRGLYDPDFHDDENWSVYGYGVKDKRFSVIRDSLLRNFCDTVYLTGAEGEIMSNVFMYGPHRILHTDASSVTCYNVTSDWQSSDAMMLLENGSDVVAFNPYLTSGTTYEMSEADETSSLVMYNRISNRNFYLPTYRSATAAEPVVTDKIELLDCDSLGGISGAELNADPAYIKEGTGSLRSSGKTTVFSASFDAIDASSLGRATLTDNELYLHLWVYVGDANGFEWKADSIRLANTRTGVGESFCWSLTSHLTAASGWSELYLPLNTGWDGKSEMDVSSLQSLTMTLNYNMLGEYTTVYVDDVYLCAIEPQDGWAYPIETSKAADYDYPVPHIEIDASRVMIYDCENTELLIGQSRPYIEINTNLAFVKEGNASFKINHTTVPFFEMVFPATDITDYDEAGYLHMWLYIDDIANIAPGGQIELTSSGSCDVGEKHWPLQGYLTQSGWNELWLPLNKGEDTSTVPYDPSFVNFIRIYTPLGETPATFYLDDIYVCDVPDGGVYNAANTGKTGTGEPSGRLPLIHACDSTSGIRQGELNKDPAYVKVGTGSIGSSTNPVRFEYTCSPVDVSAYMNGYLHMWVYAEDISKLRSGQIELTSAGRSDYEEYYWTFLSHVTQNGWNELYLPLSEPDDVTRGDLDPTRLNYMRIYVHPADGVSEPVPVLVDDIRFVEYIGD